MIALWLVVASFATYYPALVIATQDGPGGIFDKVRGKWDQGYLGKAIRCPVCLSAYTAVPWAGLLTWRLALDPFLLPILWLALAGAATFLNKVWLR